MTLGKLCDHLAEAEQVDDGVGAILEEVILGEVLLSNQWLRQLDEPELDSSNESDRVELVELDLVDWLALNRHLQRTDSVRVATDAEQLVVGLGYER